MENRVKPPRFVRGSSIDAVAEFSAFVTVTGDAGAHALAELTLLQSAGGLSAIPGAEFRSTSARELYCKQVKGWAVFYTAGMIEGVFRATVLYVADTGGGSIVDLESEAVRRMAMMEAEKHG